MEIILEIVKTCIPIIVGALIAIVPTMIEKLVKENMNKLKSNVSKNKKYMLS